MDLTIVVGTYGGDGWCRLAEERALSSVAAAGLRAVHVHETAGTVASARNAALERVTTPWVAHLDADDELEGGYAVALERSLTMRPYADVHVPEIRFIHPDGAPGLAHWQRVAGHTWDGHLCGADCLLLGNWVHVGGVVRTDLAQRVRWEEWDRYEDWAYWLAAYNLGASFVRAPGAVYRAHVRADSRNQRGVSGLAVHQAIAAAHGAPVPSA